MNDGRKTSAIRVVYDAMDEIERRIKKDGHPDGLEHPMEVFERAIGNVKPHVEVRSKRIGGANYQVPMQVTPRRRQSLAFRWIINSVRAEKGRSTHLKLADELLAASKGEGKAMATREQTHRMADANKAFAHFA
jgi:small subunit ribosomal protein S7